ncbi:MerR family transcriptional regulator [Sphaerisporangium krabiense]|uniref:DNA-binding transcriptional MerR regulator n=1 Tax=Sphaerisporangium krabiense TaxID=763782 RepID=A0A7W8Z5P8_9ACTN|nr:MerR family transcriptional regulator [Sphaerisporangium krabiense]MBB5627881.1 DNA-binding transcriptional MerR regulator [Sphaerisporangium krabiense]GII62040.1 MerR family transcriptional regulator [Sphaerisporangium krabiense]
MSVYTPGQVAEETGFSLDTLRYYERIGLLEPIERNSAGQRRFNDSHLSWLTMVRCLRTTGMPIAEMVRFAQLVRGGDETITDRIALLEAHDREVEAQIAELKEKQAAIQRKIGYYRDVLALAANTPVCDGAAPAPSR